MCGRRRRSMEGDPNLQPVDAALAAIRTLLSDSPPTTHAGRPYTNRIRLF